MAQEQTYTTVPLNDHATSRENLNPVGTSGDFLPPVGSGANTPSGSGNSKKKWSFLPNMQHGNTNSFENGGINEKAASGRSTPRRPKHQHRPGSWDLLGDRAEWEEYNPAQASVENLRFAEGDVGTTKVSL